MKYLIPHMKYYTNVLIYSTVMVLLLSVAKLQGQDRLPVREYTNPDEVVTFDRSTTFDQAVEVINEFSQEHANKPIVDRTGTESELGVTISPMHWRDALDLILRVKRLQLDESVDLFEIIEPEEGEVEEIEEAGPQIASGEESPANLRSREVRINAIFFEGNRSALREIGVDWSTLTRNVPDNIQDFISSEGGGGGGGGAGGDDGRIPTTSFDNQFVSVSAQGAQSVSQNVFNSLINFGQIGNSGIEVQALISAFEADNLGEILASPTIRVMDGQEGNIQVGEDFSIKQRDFSGNVTDEFFSTGTILTVTPQIIEENDTTFIHLDIAAERSSAQPDPVSTIIQKQEAETQSLMVDGEATAIAGLYRTESSEVRRGLPILKDLPGWFFGLKYLFGFNSQEYNMRELVILIQAEIEPGIPERFGRRNKSKFEILRDERSKILEEIQQYEDYKRGLNTDDPNPIEEKSEEDLERDLRDVEQELEEEAEQREFAVADTASQEDREEGQEEQEVPVTDPEVENEPVPIEMDEPEETEEGADPVETSEEDENEAETEEPVEEEPEQTEDQDRVQEPEETDNNGEAANSYNYYIIGSSFTVESNAENFYEDLQDEGFNAVILQSGRLYYVAYEGFDSVEEARTGLADIREYYNEDAWIYRAE